MSVTNNLILLFGLVMFMKCLRSKKKDKKLSYSLLPRTLPCRIKLNLRLKQKRLQIGYATNTPWRSRTLAPNPGTAYSQGYATNTPWHSRTLPRTNRPRTNRHRTNRLCHKHSLAQPNRKAVPQTRNHEHSLDPAKQKGGLGCRV
jgi:hypothetical protein